MKKVLTIIVSLIGAFFLGALGMLFYATTMWSKAREKFTPEEFELFDELISKTF